MKTDLTETEGEGMAFDHLAQDREKWSAVLNMIRNFWVSQNREQFLNR